MKWLPIFLVFLGLVSAVSGCGPRIAEVDEEQAISEAKQALETYLERLHEREYEEGAKMYGGSYQVLRDNNPVIDPDDNAALLRHACEINGHQCLEVRGISLVNLNKGGEYVFRVEFDDEDGTQFVRGPCCGGNATDFPPEYAFLFTVVRSEGGEFRVLDLPPYVP